MARQEDPPTTPYFEETISELTTENSATVLAKAAENLLKRFNDTFENAGRSIEREGYQLKLLRETGKMRLRYDAVKWFDFILPHQSASKDDCARYGSAYVNECLTRKNDNDVAPCFTNEAVRFTAAAVMNLTCVKPGCTCEKLHTPLECTNTIELTEGDPITCGQFFDRATSMDSFCIEDERFTLHSRPGATCDIVLFPVSHTSNEIFVTMESTWKAIFEVEERLRATLAHFAGGDQIAFPIESVYINFGSWTTAMTKNELLKTAHAHVHLLLTPDAISTFNQNGLRRPNREAFVARYALNLTGCHRDPVDYEYDDAIALQRSRILSYHMSETQETMKTSKREIVTEFSAHEKSEPSSPSTLFNDPHESTTSNATFNDEQNDSPSEEGTGTTLHPQIPLSLSNSEVRKKPSECKNEVKRKEEKKYNNLITTTNTTNISVGSYCCIFLSVMILIFAIVIYRYW